MDTFRQGYDARKDGRPQSANPYPRDTDSGIAWDTGWSSADQDIMMDDIERQQAERMRNGDVYSGKPVRVGTWGRMEKSMD